MPQITGTLYVTDRAAWRVWLAEHHASAREVWLVYPRKQTGEPRIAYGDAVEEALCFGWIDSTVKTLDADRTAQKFSPRRPGSGYSQPNKERLRRLIADGRVAPHVLQALRDIPLDDFTIPPDILEALRASPAAWDNLRRWPGAYLRIRVAYVDGARGRPEEFDKRLRNLIRKSEEGTQFGFGIESFF